MVYNGYYKVMSNSPKMGHLATPDGGLGKHLSAQNGEITDSFICSFIVEKMRVEDGFRS